MSEWNVPFLLEFPCHSKHELEGTSTTDLRKWVAGHTVDGPTSALASAQYGQRKMKSGLSIEMSHGTQPLIKPTSAEHRVTLHPAQSRR